MNLLFACAAAMAQASDNDFLDSFGLARMKNYSSHRISSGSRFVLSNDDSKRIMPGQTFVMADISGAGMITHLWVTIAQNEFGLILRLLTREFMARPDQTAWEDLPVFLTRSSPC